MENVLETYQLPYSADEPVICKDEVSVQLIGETRTGIPMQPGAPERCDYKYVRKGTANIFMVCEPLKGFRHVKVTERRTRTDWAELIREVVDKIYPDVKRIKRVMDNLNTHGAASLTCLAQLHQCSKLSKIWTQENVAEATRAGLQWGRAIELISIWGEGKQRNQPELIQECKKLITEFRDLDRKTRNALARATRKAWDAKLNNLRKRARSDNEIISKKRRLSRRRLLGEKKEVVIIRLTAVAQMIEEMQEFLSLEAHPACSGLSSGARDDSDYRDVMESARGRKIERQMMR